MFDVNISGLENCAACVKLDCLLQSICRKVIL